MASTDELYESLKDGKITMEDFMDTLVELDEEGLEGFQSFADQARNATDNIGTAITNVRNRVKKGFASMLESVNEAFKNTSIGSIATGINKVSKAMQKLLDEFGKRLKENKQFTGMIENLAKGIEKLSKATEKIDDKKMAKFVDIALGLGKLSPILIGVGKALPKVTSKITSFSGKISKIFGTTIPSVIGGVFSGGAVITALVGALGFLEQTTGGKVSEMINNIAEQIPSMLRIALNTINSRLPSILLAGTMMLEKILTTIMQNAPMIMNIVTTLLTQFTTTLFQNLPIITQSLITLLTNAVQSLIPQIPTILHSAVTGILDTLVTITNPENLSKILQCALDIILKLGEGLANEVGSEEFWEKISKVVDGIVSFLLNPENVEKIFETGGKLLGALGKGMLNGVTHMFDNLDPAKAEERTKKWLEDGTFKAVDDWWTELTGKLSGKEQEEIEREKKSKELWRTITYNLMRTNGNSSADGYIQGVDEKQGEVNQTMDNMATNTMNSYTNPLAIRSPSRVFEGFGENIIQGLINGINGMVGALFSRIRSIASNVINIFSNILRIGSPSKVFEKFGIFTMQGYENGVVKQLPKTEQILSNGMTNLMKDVDTAMLQSQFENSFGLSPSLNQSINSQAPQVNVSVQNNMQTDFMGNLVNNIKTYSNGSRNDYNYGAV
jgi:phage-related protein